MIVTGMNVKSDKLKYCPACGAELKPGTMGSYHGPRGEYKECSKCYCEISLGLDGRDW